MNATWLIARAALPWLLVAAAIGGAWWWADSRGYARAEAEAAIVAAQRDLADAQARADNAERMAALERKHRSTEQGWNKQQEKANVDARNREAFLRQQLLSLHGDLDRLRDDAATAQSRLVQLPSAAPGSLATATEYAAAAAELYQQCARELASMAAKADGHAADARTLIEAWPK